MSKAELAATLRAYVERVHEMTHDSHGSTAVVRHGVMATTRISASSADVMPGTKKQCYCNAALVAQSRSDLIYCEGYATSTDLPLVIEHAWLMTRDGEVIDPTWDHESDVEYAYYGVRFDTDFLWNRILETGEYGLLHVRSIVIDVLRLSEIALAYDIGEKA